MLGLVTTLNLKRCPGKEGQPPWNPSQPRGASESAEPGGPWLTSPAMSTMWPQAAERHSPGLFLQLQHMYKTGVISLGSYEIQRIVNLGVINPKVQSCAKGWFLEIS